MKDTTISAYAIPGLKQFGNRRFDLRNDSKVVFIEEIACEYFGETISGLKVKSRKRNKVLTRYVIMYLLRLYTKMTLAAIGDRFRQCDHTTVIHGIRTLRDLMQQDEVLKFAVESLEKRIK